MTDQLDRRKLAACGEILLAIDVLLHSKHHETPVSPDVLLFALREKWSPEIISRDAEATRIKARGMLFEVMMLIEQLPALGERRPAVLAIINRILTAAERMAEQPEGQPVM